MPRKIMTLSNWSFVATSLCPFTAPEALPKSYKGTVDSHPTLGDNAKAVISHPIAYDPEARIIKTVSGSFYRLAEPHPEYAARFPNAAQQAHDALARLPLLPPPSINLCEHEAAVA